MRIDGQAIPGTSKLSLASEILGRRLGLPVPETRDVVVHRDIEIPMDDGTILLANRYTPRDERPRPTILVRSPYGRGALFGLIYGRLFAERGFQSVVQSVRGTFGSGGEFQPFNERADGLATIGWIERQPWFDGRLAMAGASYLGIAQWAVAHEAGDRLDALAFSITASQVQGQALGGGPISLETTVAWTMILDAQEGRLGPIGTLGRLRKLPRLVDDLPIGGLDAVATGKSLPFFAEWMAHTRPDDPYWAERDFSAGVVETKAPAQFVGGRYDIFLPWMLDDFVTLQNAGRRPQLVIGPWAHMSPGLLRSGTREALAWLRAHLLGDRSLLHDAPVRVHVGGSRIWREFETWPPDSQSVRFHLHPGRRLARKAPDEPADDGYYYDPALPTPSVGGPGLLANAPVVDNRALEARADVLAYTTEPLDDDFEAIGPVSVEIWVRSDREHFDLFARVCDVLPDGTSLNVCDAIDRISPDNGGNTTGDPVRVSFELWPIAHRFAAGHRIRLQVSSGAHPRYARNTGTGEDIATATRVITSHQQVLHGPEHPSSVVLPMVD